MSTPSRDSAPFLWTSAKCRIHALAADGHKWLLGPEGCGILYVQQDIQDSIEPVEFGWTNVAGYTTTPAAT